MQLPPAAVTEILQLASSRADVPSPRGVADLPGDDSGDRDVAKALRHFPSRAVAERAINQCATRFLKHVVGKALTLMEYSCRMRMKEKDVKRALSLFVKADAGDSWYSSFPSGAAPADEERPNEEDEEMDENWRDEGDDGGDEALEADDVESDLDDETFYVEEAGAAFNDETLENFDGSFPPVDGVEKLSDRTFKEDLLRPTMWELRCDMPTADGAVSTLKLAMYSFLVAKLS